MMETPEPGGQAGVAQGQRHRIEKRLPDVSCPALVVRGSADRVVPQRWAEQVTCLLPRGQPRVMPGATHTMTYLTNH